MANFSNIFRNQVKEIDGTGSGLDADLLRGLPADFTVNKALNGYQKLPSGLIIQWGRGYVGGKGAVATVYFPIAFPNVCYVVTSVPNGSSSGGGQSDYWGVYNVHVNYFQVKNDYDGGQGVYYMAVGY